MATIKPKHLMNYFGRVIEDVKNLLVCFKFWCVDNVMLTSFQRLLIQKLHYNI